MATKTKYKATPGTLGPVNVPASPTLADLIPQLGAIPGANVKAPANPNDTSSLSHLLHLIGHGLQEHNPLGAYDNTVTGGATTVGGGQPAAPSTPAKTKAKGKAKTSAPQEQKFDLSAADTAAAAPYVSQLYAALGIQPGGQATANSEIPGGLAQYLTNVPSNIAQTLTQGANTEATANQGMIGAEQSAMNNAGNAGLLGDLLNAAKYQAIYKQTDYATPPPTNTPLGQLYRTVVSGGNALTGGTSTTTNPFNSPQPGTTSPGGTKNPYSTPPNV
jgi:hypothetical protein